MHMEAARRQPVRGALQCHSLAVDHEHLRAALGEQRRQRETEPPPRPRHHRDLSTKAL